MSDDFSGLIRHARVLWRAERLIGELRLKQVLRQTGLVAFAGLIAVFGLAMLNIAAYFGLRPYWGDALSMLTVGVVDLVIAGILVAVASNPGTSAEYDLASELRDHAIEGLETEAEVAADRVRGLVNGPLSLAGSAASIVASLLSTFLRRGR